MDEEKREARRKLLAELEGAWDTPRAGAVTGEPVQPPTPAMRAALDAAADRLVESLDPPPTVPSMDELDAGWEEEDEEDEEDEPEPELPDERLDPVAYAAAKKARDERMAARRERKRVRAEAKKARRKARVEAAKSKQKAKKSRPSIPRAPASAKAKARADATRRPARPASDEVDNDRAEDEDEDEIEEAASAPSRAKAPPSRTMARPRMLSGTNTWMLAIAILVFIAAAIFAAVVAR